MKDLIIKGKAIRREIFIWLGCLVAAICLNVFAIIKYSRPATELFSMIGYVVVVSLIIYLILLLIRLIFMFIYWIINNLRKKQ